jgi:hypothetical protein
MVSVSSVGAGALGVTAVMLLYPRLPTARIVGSDIAHAVPLSCSPGSAIGMLGSIDWHLLGALVPGSLPGILLGSYVSVRRQSRSCAAPCRQHCSSSRIPRIAAESPVQPAADYYLKLHQTSAFCLSAANLQQSLVQVAARSAGSGRARRRSWNSFFPPDG